MNSWTASAGGGSQKKLCELCKEEAFVYCFADAAFLCLNCDAKVHHANFLVARHLRHFLCSKCKSPFCHKKQPTFLASQAQTKTTHLCKACCSPENNPMSPSSSDCLSSSCESSSTDLKHKRITKANTTHSSSTSASEVTISNSSNDNNSKNRLEGIFVIWCKKLGLSRLDVVPKASAVLRLCLERLTGLPFMVSLAAAFWSGLRMSGAQRSVATWQILKQLGNLSGVPAKLIVAVEPKLARAMRLRKKRIRQDLEEGWAECNV